MQVRFLLGVQNFLIMTRREINKKFKTLKEAGLLNDFTDEQIECIKTLYKNQQNILLLGFNEDEKFLLNVHGFKKLVLK